MTTVTYTELLGFRGHIETNFQAIMATEEQAPKIARYNDIVTGNYFTITGSHLTYDTDGNITGGTITEIDFNSKDNIPFAVFEDAHYKAAEFWHEFQTSGMTALLSQALAGKDTIEGTLLGDDLHGGKGGDTIRAGNGDDILSGDLGNDRLTGGKGNDRFDLSLGGGNDVVTDFDADGKHHDMILIGSGNVTIEKHGADTLVELDDGSTMTLLGVKASHVTLADDFLFV